MAEDKGKSIAEGLLSQEGDEYHPHFYEMQKWLKDPSADTLPKGVRPVVFRNKDSHGFMVQHPRMRESSTEIVDADDFNGSKWLAYDLPSTDRPKAGDHATKYLYPNPLAANVMDNYSLFLTQKGGKADVPLYQKDNAYHMEHPVEVYGQGFINMPGQGTWGARVKQVQEAPKQAPEQAPDQAPDQAPLTQEAPAQEAKDFDADMPKNLQDGVTEKEEAKDFDADMPKNLQDGVTEKEVATEKVQAENAIDNMQEELFETSKATSLAEKLQEEQEDANAIEAAQKQVKQAAQAELDFDAGREQEEPEIATSTGSGTDTQAPANTYSLDESQFQKEPEAASQKTDAKKAEPEELRTLDEFFGQFGPKAFSKSERDQISAPFLEGMPQNVYDTLNKTYKDRLKSNPAPAKEASKDVSDATITPDEGAANIDAVEHVDNKASGDTITPDEGKAELGEVKHYPNSQKDVTKNKYSVAGPMLLGSVLQGLGGVADILASGGINFNPLGQGSFGTGNTYRSPLAGKFGAAANAMASSLVAPAVAKKRAEMLENFVKDSKDREKELLDSPHYKSLSPTGKRDVLVKFKTTDDLLLRSMLHTFDVGAPVPKPSDKRVKQDIKPTKKLKPREVVKLTRKNVLSDEDEKIIQDSMQGVDAMELAKAILEEGPPFDAADMELLHTLANGDSYGYDIKDAGCWRDDVLNGYMKHIHNYFYKYKPEATDIDPEIDPNEQHIGPMAQDIEKVNPAAIQETDEGVKTVDTGRLALMNAGAIAELAREVAKLKGGK